LGHTNREVAQALFLTISTVEQHLTRIYRKLDVSGRSDLSVCLELDLANPGATLGVPLSPLGAESTGDDGAILASMECGSGRLFPSGDSGGTRTICP